MDELTTDTRHKRKPIVAALLSIYMPGLGHIYCGRMVKGIVILFLNYVLIPIITLELLVDSSHIRITVFIVSICSALTIWLTAIIHSFYVARHTRPDYKLKEYNRWYVYVLFVFIIGMCSSQTAENFRFALGEPFRTSSSSMYPTIEYHDRILANKISYKNNDPKRGDVVVFISPEDRHVINSKRVIAIAGDTLEMKGNQLFINGVKLERDSRGRASYIGKDPNKKDVKVEGELFIEKNGQLEYMIFLEDIYDSKSFPPPRWADFPETKVPKNNCFLLGDNRNLSEDSRHFGSVPLAMVKGRAEYLYWPANDWSNFGKIK